MSQKERKQTSIYTLGIYAVYHDSAACLVKDGVVIAAAEEEHFTHVKHAKRPIPFSTYELPFNAIDYCLREVAITLKDVAHIAYSVAFPHSLGLLVEQVTSYLGFLPSSDEYKVMALASYGKPRYLNAFREIVQLGTKGAYTIAPPRLEERFGPARRKGEPLEQHHYDIAHSLQTVLEETVLDVLVIGSFLLEKASSTQRAALQ